MKEVKWVGEGGVNLRFSESSNSDNPHPPDLILSLLRSGIYYHDTASPKGQWVYRAGSDEYY